MCCVSRARHHHWCAAVGAEHASVTLNRVWKADVRVVCVGVHERGLHAVRRLLLLQRIGREHCLESMVVN